VSQRPKNEFEKAGDDLLKWVADLKQKQAQLAAAEATRRAKLSVAERAAEDHTVAQRQANAVYQAQLKKFARMGDAILKRETWTIAKFCWLLVAENPEEDTSWTFFSGRSSDIEAEHSKYVSILESCIGTRLIAVNPSAASKDQRFTVQSLTDAARAKRLGSFEALADAMGLPHQQNKPQPAAALPAIGTATRERSKAKRQKALVAMAKAIAKDGEGVVTATEIRLSISGVELNKRFKSQHPEWKRVTDKTLEADRAECRPVISVARGRPKNSP